MSRRSRATPIVILLVLLAGKPAGIQADPLGECWIQAENQIEVRACLERTRKLSEQAMAAALALAGDAVDELDRITGRREARPALQASQERWRAFRDDNCRLRAVLAAGGSGAGTFELSCRITMARQRADELARLASDRGYPLP